MLNPVQGKMKMNAKISQKITEQLEACDALSEVHAVDQHSFRQGMAQLAAAVNVITTDGVAGQAGFTASAVCSVTDTPPTLLVCLNRSASVYDTFKANGVLCVNTLQASQQQLSNVFGGKTPMAARFAQGQWSTLMTEAPVLDDALVSFDCEVIQSVAMGSHDVLFCQVKAIRQHDQQNALLYFNRSYCEPQPMC